MRHRLSGAKIRSVKICRTGRIALPPKPLSPPKPAIPPWLADYWHLYVWPEMEYEDGKWSVYVWVEIDAYNYERAEGRTHEEMIGEAHESIEHIYFVATSVYATKTTLQKAWRWCWKDAQGKVHLDDLSITIYSDAMNGKWRAVPWPHWDEEFIET